MAPSPTPPGHDGQDEEEEGLERRETQGVTDAHTDQHAGDLTAEHREKDTHKPLDQGATIHAHNAADDNAADIEIKNIAAFKKLRG